MPETKAWTLTDVEKRLWVETFETNARQLGQNGPDWSIKKQRLHGGLVDGVDLVEVDNGALSFSVAPTRGMGIWRGAYRGNFLGWHSPVRGPVNPQFVHLSDRGGLGWLEGYDEWIVRCGLDSNGAPGKDVVLDNEGNPTEMDLTLHGRIANQPAHKVEVHVTEGNPSELVVLGEVDETMLFSPSLRLKTKISTVAGSNRLTIIDEVVNLRGVDAELELLYHCNMGGPFLEAGSQLVAPARLVAPRDARAAQDIETYASYLGPTPGYIEQVYWYELAGDPAGNTLAMLRNAHGDQAVVFRYNLRELPAFTQWKNTVAESDGYVTGLEPATNFPNPKVFERKQGRVVKLAPHASYQATLVIDVHDRAAEVLEVEKEVAALQGDQKTTVHREPQPKYSEV